MDSVKYSLVSIKQLLPAHIFMEKMPTASFKVTTVLSADTASFVFHFNFRAWVVWDLNRRGHVDSFLSLSEQVPKWTFAWKIENLNWYIIFMIWWPFFLKLTSKTIIFSSQTPYVALVQVCCTNKNMPVEKIDTETIVELLGVTLFSVYSEIVFAMWMPAICHYPSWLHLILQFWFIGLPQATIIIHLNTSKFFILYLDFLV